MTGEFVKQVRGHVVLLALAMACLAEVVDAQDFPVRLNISLVATVQENQATDSNRSTTKNMRLVTSNFLSFIAAHLGTPLPKGASLALEDQIGQENACVIVDRRGHIITNVSGFFVANSSTNIVLRGWSKVYVARSLASSLGSFTFDDGIGNSFVLSGVSKRSYVYAASPLNSITRERFAFEFKGNGEGKIGGKIAVVSGTISGSGGGSTGFEDQSMDAFGPGYLFGISWLRLGTQSNHALPAIVPINPPARSN